MVFNFYFIKNLFLFFNEIGFLPFIILKFNLSYQMFNLEVINLYIDNSQKQYEVLKFILEFIYYFNIKDNLYLYNAFLFSINSLI